MLIYDNFEEFKERHIDIAKRLLNDIDKGEWMNEEIYFYNSLEDFAEWELTEGWYAECDLNRDFRGAPNPIDYIDLELFGKALSNSWDDSMYWTNGEYVVATSCGW